MCPDLPSNRLARREVLVRLFYASAVSAASVAAGLWLDARNRRPSPPEAFPAAARDHRVPDQPELPAMVVATGGTPAELLQVAVRSMGGIQRFVRPGDIVVIKPNAAWERRPEQAATTNPDLVAALARLCREAGAKRVLITDVTCHEPRRAFTRSGLLAAAQRSGAEIVFPESRRFREVNLRGQVLRWWPVLEPFLEADKVINVPVAKHHSLTRVTLGMKNWYGIIGGQRHRLHQRIHESIVDLAAFMKPTLTIIDAWRVLLRNGPTGGSLSDVLEARTLVVSTDPVAADAYVARRFWNLLPEQLPYLGLAVARRLGRIELEPGRWQRLEL